MQLVATVAAAAWVRTVCASTIPQQNDEFIPTNSGQHINVAHNGGQATRHLGQSSVTRLVTKHIIDRLETIEVKIERGESAKWTLCATNDLAHLICQVKPVGESSANIAAGHSGQIPLRCKKLFKQTVESRDQVTHFTKSSDWQSLQ